MLLSEPPTGAPYRLRWRFCGVSAASWWCLGSKRPRGGDWRQRPSTAAPKYGGIDGTVMIDGADVVERGRGCYQRSHDERAVEEEESNAACRSCPSSRCLYVTLHRSGTTKREGNYPPQGSIYPGFLENVSKSIYLETVVVLSSIELLELFISFYPFGLCVCASVGAPWRPCDDLPKRERDNILLLTDMLKRGVKDSHCYQKTRLSTK